MRTAIASPDVADRFHRLVHPTPVPIHGCLIWTGAISGSGHGRFWLGTDESGHDVVVIAHRWAWALSYGIDALLSAPVIRHRCDNPVCQNVKHLEAGRMRENVEDFLNRREIVGSPLRDIRGAAGRARALRDADRAGADLSIAWESGRAPVDEIDPLPGL